MNETRQNTFTTAAYGGDGWQPRERTHGEDIGGLWAHCGMESEWAQLHGVLLHAPGEELLASAENPDSVQMLDTLDLSRAQEEHQQMAEAYVQQGVEVHRVSPGEPCRPNQMFCADLFAMTPEGAILARPASVVRAGEEREVAAALARLGVPILRTLTGSATFEGADLIWLSRERALLGIGLRTNMAAANQIAATLQSMSVELTAVDMPFGTMHLMGMVRIVDRNLALTWPRRTPHRAVTAMRECGYAVVFLPESDDFESGRAFNFVTLGPRKILTVAGNPGARSFYEGLGIECIETPARELSKAAGAVGCLTGVLHRETG